MDVLRENFSQKSIKVVIAFYVKYIISTVQRKHKAFTKYIITNNQTLSNINMPCMANHAHVFFISKLPSAANKNKKLAANLSKRYMTNQVLLNSEASAESKDRQNQ